MVVGAAALVGSPPSGADGPQTLACSVPALDAAVAAGGEWAYGGNCSLNLSNGFAGYTVPAGRTLSIDGNGFTVTISPPATYPRQGFMTVAGTVTLTRLTVRNFQRRGANGAPGTIGTAGTAGSSPGNSGPGSPGLNGSPGTPGGDGGDGGHGADASGGGFVVAPTGTLTLDRATLAGLWAVGGDGGRGGDGGHGGNGGHGGYGDGANQPGGNGAPGARGGDGGRTGDGGDARGGAIYSQGRIVATGTRFFSNAAVGGIGGIGATGGDGGLGGDGGGGSGNPNNGTAGMGGNGAAAGDGGNGGIPGPVGDARGGAIYNDGGTLELNGVTFDSNRGIAGLSTSGYGGDGGLGGDAGTTPWSSGTPTNGSPGAGGDGGDGGASGAAPTTQGGALYSTTPWEGTDLVTTGNAVAPRTVTIGLGGAAGAGGSGGGGDPGPPGGPAGSPGSPTTIQNGNVGSSTDPDFFPAPDNGARTLSVSDPTAGEPDPGEASTADFVISVDPAPADPVTVSYATADGTATASGGDYTPKDGSLTFQPGGPTAYKIEVPVLKDDTDDEPDETFTLALSGESGASVARRTGTATIVQRRRISGTLTDKKGSPIAGGTVRVDGLEDRVVTTDADGRYATRVLPGIYYVQPDSPPPGQPADDGAFEPVESDDCVPLETKCAMNITNRDEVANFRYTYKVPVRGEIVDPVGKPVVGAALDIVGTDDEGRAVSAIARTSDSGGYSRLLAPGVYTVTPRDQEGLKTSSTYKVTTCEGATQLNPQACKVRVVNKALTASFTRECEQQVSFNTSMVAVGCLLRTDKAGKVFKAKGPVRINGVDFEAAASTSAITFDTTKKSVSWPASRMWITRGALTTKWLAFEMPAFTQRFTGRSVEYTLALGKSSKGWNLNGTVNSTLYGFPSHAPAIRLESTAGRTTLNVQLSTPPKDGAVIDPQTGLWKAPNDFGKLRVAYPDTLRGGAAVTNDNGLQSIEVSFAPSSVFVFGANSSNGWFGKLKIEGKAPTPNELYSNVQLARVTGKYDFAANQWRFGGTLVAHFRKGGAASAPIPTLPAGVLSGIDTLNGKLLNGIGADPKGNGALSAMIFDAELGLKFDGGAAFALTPVVSSVPGAKQVAGILDRMSLRANGLNDNRYAGKGPIYLQRLVVDIGRDTDAARQPLKATLGAGWTFGPRVRSDLWFQELASLDVDGSLYIDPQTTDLQVVGNGTVRAVNTRLLGGRLVWNVMGGGGEVSGDAGFALRSIALAAAQWFGDTSFLGKARLSWDSRRDWKIEGDGRIAVVGKSLEGRFRWNDTVFGMCASNGWGVYFDGAAHATTSCAFETFGTGTRSRALPTAAPDGSFTVPAGTRRLAVEVAGVGAAPRVAVDGPGGVRVEADAEGASLGDAVSILPEPSRKVAYVVLDAPAPGPWKVTALPGSPAVGGLRFAGPAPTPKVTAKVRTRGCRTAVSWSLAPRPGQKVELVEEGAGDSVIATVTKAKGTVAFTPRPSGAVTRRLVAVVTQDGMPRARIALGRFRAPGARVATPAGVRASLTGRTVRASWRGSCGATQYVVAVLAKGSTTPRYVRTRGRRATVRLPKRASSAQVRVWAVSMTRAFSRPAARTAR